MLASSLPLEKIAINTFKSTQTREPIPDNWEPTQRTYPHGYAPLEASNTKLYNHQGSIREGKLLEMKYKTGIYYRDMILSNFGSWLNSPCWVCCLCF